MLVTIISTDFEFLIDFTNKVKHLDWDLFLVVYIVIICIDSILHYYPEEETSDFQKYLADFLKLSCFR